MAFWKCIFLGHPVYPIKILLIINHDNILSEKLLNKCEYWEWTPCSFWWCFTSSSWFQLLRTGFFKCECWEWYSLTCEQSDFVSEKELAKCEKLEYFGKRMDPLLPLVVSILILVPIPTDILFQMWLFGDVSNIILFQRKIWLNVNN